MGKIRRLKAEIRKRDDIIAEFIIRDYIQQDINFTIGDKGFDFPTKEDVERSIERAKHMGYVRWLFGNEEPSWVESK